MKLRVLVEVIGAPGGKPARKMTTIEVPAKRLKLVEKFHGDDALEFILDEALTGATGAFQTQKKAEVVEPTTAPKEKLEEVLGLGIIENMDAKERRQGPGGVMPGGGPQALPPLPRAGAAPPPAPGGGGGMGLKPPGMSMSPRPGAIPTPGRGRQ